MSEPRWELESLRIRVLVPYWPLEPDLAERLTAGLSVWAAGVANAAGAMVGKGHWASREPMCAPGVMYFVVPVKPMPE